MSLKSIDGKNVVTEEVEKLCSSNEEADTRIMLHCNNVAANSPESSVMLVRSPDTDMFIILVRFVPHINQTLLFDTGTADKHRLVNVQAVAKDLRDEINLALVPLLIYRLRYDQCFCEKRESEAAHTPQKTS